jgi:hypothetical protein
MGSNSNLMWGSQQSESAPWAKANANLGALGGLATGAMGGLALAAVAGDGREVPLPPDNGGGSEKLPKL